MLKLYRGLIDLVVRQGETFTNDLRYHIRKFNDGHTDGNNFGVSGFWNFLLEATMILILRIVTAFGILFIMSLAIVFFPLHAIKMSISNIMNHRAEPFPEEHNHGN